MLAKKINQPNIVIGLKEDLEMLQGENDNELRKFLAILPGEKSGNYNLVTNLHTTNASVGNYLLYKLSFKINSD